MSMSLQETAVPAPDDVNPPRRADLVDSADVGIPWWEWVFAGLALLVIARSPVLLLRQETMDLFGGAIPRQWRDDTLLVTAFLTVQVAALALVLVRCGSRPFLRQPWLLGLLVVAWVSTAWSLEPAVTQQRALTFAGTAAIGVYLGARWSLRGQVMVVAGAGAAGALASAGLLIFWWDRAQAVLGGGRRWHGIYLNANMLALAMAVAVIATVVVALSTAGRWRMVAVGAAAVEALLLVMSKSMSSIGACAAALAAMAFVAVVRQVGPTLRRWFVIGSGVVVVGGGAAVIALRNSFLDGVDRSTTLSGRTEMWDINLDYVADKPLHGYGFEALWRNQPAITETQARWGRYPWSSHNGYFEILLGVGLIGLVLFVAFLSVTAWRSGRLAWLADRRDYVSLWPVGLLTYALVINVFESFITSNEPLLALVVAVGVSTTGRSLRSGGARSNVQTNRTLDYLFIVSYGRSGSTLLQGILCSIPGYLIRGENRAAVYRLYQHHRACVASRDRFVKRRPRARRRALTPRDAWYGIEDFPPDVSIERLRSVVLDTIIRPGPDDRVVGFKEIRWGQKDLDEYVAFLRDLFPGARFVFNTRSLDDVVRSKWWADRPDAHEFLEQVEGRFADLRARLGDAAFHVRYDEYVADPSALHGLFDWLGEEFDEERIRSVIAQPHSY